jgi:hypothetical protein
VLLAMLSVPLTAQSRNPLGGFWIGGGIGGGFGRAECASVCTGDRDAGLSALLGVGGTVSRHVRLGVEGAGWRRQEGEAEDQLTFELGGVNGVAYWYPNPENVPWFLKVGFGAIGYRLSDNDDENDDNITATSFGGQFGVGYDLKFSILTLTPYFNFLGSFFAELEQGGEPLSQSTLTLIQFGVGLSLY